MSSNLPPGVRDCDLPGNRPEDEAWERVHEYLDAIATDFALTPDEAHDLITMGMGALKCCRQRLEDWKIMCQDIALGHLKRIEPDDPVKQMASRITDMIGTGSDGF